MAQLPLDAAQPSGVLSSDPAEPHAFAGASRKRELIDQRSRVVARLARMAGPARSCRGANSGRPCHRTAARWFEPLSGRAPPRDGLEVIEREQPPVDDVPSKRSDTRA